MKPAQKNHHFINVKNVLPVINVTKHNEFVTP